MFFSDPELMPILASTLVAACYECEQNKGVVQQEISTDMLLSLLRSCRNMCMLRSNPNTDSFPVNESGDNQINGEHKKVQGDGPLKPSRHNLRSSRKNGASGNNMKNGKLRNQRDCKAIKGHEETAMALKPNMPVSETSSMMLPCRLPLSFINKAELFFSSGTSSIADEV